MARDSLIFRRFFMRLCLFLFLLPLALLRAEHPLGGPLPASYRKNVADQLCLPDPAKRIAATVRFHADGPGAADEFRAGLLRGEATATGNLRRLLQLVKPTEPSFEAIGKEAEEYRLLADAARALVLTDHHKDKQKFAEMDKAFAAADKAYERLMRTLRPGGNTPAVQLLDALQWAAEVRRDLTFCDGKTTDLAKLPLLDVLEIESAAEPVKDFVRKVEPVIALREFHRAVGAAHAAARWAKSDQVQFALLLNSRRAVLGLRPFLLSERLSEACGQHSEEMVRLKYFAHESPVKENKTPWDRAKNAKFEGGAGGECIYTGGPAAQASHTGWWYSDGHRLILYGGGNTQGIARFGGGMWTFLSGTYTKFPL
jgi:uncharacterized protein YkwD